MADVAVAMAPLINGLDKPKKPSKHPDNPEKSRSKKRHRDSNNPIDGSERKHKRSKSDATSLTVDQIYPDNTTHTNEKGKKKSSKDVPFTNGNVTYDEIETPELETKKKKKKKRKEEKPKHEEEPEPEMETVATSLEDNETIDSKKKKDKKAKKDKKDKKSRHHAEHDGDAMDIDSTIPNGTAAIEKLSDHDYPFFTQTVSQYLPLHPFGIIEPVQGYADQHLKPLLNRYVPSFGGVLLAYRNPRLGEAPGRGSLSLNSDEDDIAVLESINEYAVTFGWLTVEVDLFRPARGAWLEGLVNLQGGGHIGVVCWGKFNASIEAERLPRGWRWVDLLPKGKNQNTGTTEAVAMEEDEAEEVEAEEEPEVEAEVDSSQVHIAGYWVDENKKRIKSGTKLCFRIKNYEVGVSGDYGYLSIEGTMLSEADEEKKVREEVEKTRRRKLRQGGGLLRGEQRRLPEYSMTKFGQDEVQENELQRVELVQPAAGGDETDP
ncbi:hypothetical protein F5Y16DRAFT_53153 [Xylariaceae sp. FL0255]|nr:hypothetical protein F5Y16DRAFT_53153 [Xylariaceae sp. FL0255]